jgi:glycosyltransferase involved in cell wall biosynthesis
VDIVRLPASLRRPGQGQIRGRTILNPARGATGLLHIVRLATRLRRNRIKLIHAQSLRACILAGLAGRLAGIPVIWHIHSVVGSPAMSSTGRSLMGTLSRSIPRHIICNSEATAADFKAVNNRVTVVPSGVDSRRFSPNGSRSNGHPRVGMIARFAPIKGQHVFVQAAQGLGTKYPTVEFVLAGAPLFGEEGYAEDVRQAAASTKGRSLQFLGFVEDVPALLEELDIIVSPSTQPEGFGQVIVEAMMAGKPVVASASGGPTEVIEDGVTGRLVPPGDAAALTRAISEMLDQPEQARIMGCRARERALQLYDIRETTRQIEAVYERVLFQR